MKVKDLRQTLKRYDKCDASVKMVVVIGVGNHLAIFAELGDGELQTTSYDPRGVSQVDQTKGVEGVGSVELKAPAVGMAEKVGV